LGKGDVNITKNSLPEDGLPIVEDSNVRESYVPGSLENPVLSSINLKIERGEFLAIKGPSGSGKSTLVNLIGCLDRPTEEQVLVRGRDLNKISDEELARVRELEIGFVFQTFNLISRLTAFENVLLPNFANLRISIDPRKRTKSFWKLWDCTTGNLDSKTGAEILCIFKDVNMEGRTIVIVTHYPEIAKYADRVLLVKDGIIQYN
jgi:putative ABC transport system ATP-binding protein